MIAPHPSEKTWKSGGGHGNEIFLAYRILEAHVGTLAHQEAANLGMIVARCHVQRRAVLLKKIE